MNKYESVFKENMNSGELRSIYLTIGRTLKKEDRQELNEAYKKVSRAVSKREMEETLKYGIMTSD